MNFGEDILDPYFQKINLEFLFKIKVNILFCVVGYLTGKITGQKLAISDRHILYVQEVLTQFSY